MTDALADPEKMLLLMYLRDQREHVLGIVDGLDDAALRRPVLPSGWSCLAMVRHLALDVERFWFQAVVAGDRAAIAGLDPDPASGWRVDPEEPAAATLALYRREAARTDAIIAATPLDAAPAWWPAELFGDWRMESLHRVVLYTMTETAGHAGHLDIVRELIDGRTWLILT